MVTHEKVRICKYQTLLERVFSNDKFLAYAKLAVTVTLNFQIKILV